MTWGQLKEWAAEVGVEDDSPLAASWRPLGPGTVELVGIHGHPRPGVSSDQLVLELRMGPL